MEHNKLLKPQILYRTMVSPELAEILGLLCAEGCHVVSHSTYFEGEGIKRRLRTNKRSERIEFYNKDKKLLRHLQRLLAQEFNYQAKITKLNKINIGNRVVMRRLIQFTELCNLKWRVPEEVVSGSDDVKKSFIRGYFDGDGTASRTLRFFSVNRPGLWNVGILLKHLSIDHSFNGPMLKINRKPLYIIRVRARSKERFLSEIKPISKNPDMRG